MVTFTILNVPKMTRIADALVAGVETTLRQLRSPCVLGHGEMLRTRDEDGQLALECADCGHVRPVLQQPAIKGPKHHAAPVAGAPVLKVKRLRPRERTYLRSA
jgi:hypothetical protein